MNEYNYKWMKIEDAITQFWQRYRAEFLEQQRKRVKWNKGEVDIQPGTLVMVLDDFNERLRWPLAIVLDVERDSAGLVQTVILKYKGHQTRRGIRSLAPVPLED